MSKLWAFVDRCALVVGALCTLGCLWYTRQAFLDGHPGASESLLFSMTKGELMLNGALVVAVGFALLAVVAILIFFVLRRQTPAVSPRRRMSPRRRQAMAAASAASVQVSVIVGAGATSTADMHLIEPNRIADIGVHVRTLASERGQTTLPSVARAGLLPEPLPERSEQPPISVATDGSVVDIGEHTCRSDSSD